MFLQNEFLYIFMHFLTQLFDSIYNEVADLSQNLFGRLLLDCICLLCKLAWASMITPLGQEPKLLQTLEISFLCKRGDEI